MAQWPTCLVKGWVWFVRDQSLGHPHPVWASGWPPLISDFLWMHHIRETVSHQSPASDHVRGTCVKQSHTPDTHAHGHLKGCFHNKTGGEYQRLQITGHPVHGWELKSVSIYPRPALHSLLSTAFLFISLLHPPLVFRPGINGLFASNLSSPPPPFPLFLSTISTAISLPPHPSSPLLPL